MSMSGLKRILGATALALVLAETPAMAQAVPDTIRSSGLTRAQTDELTRRLARLQGRFNALSRETNLRETAVRNIAIEILAPSPISISTLIRS